MPDRARHNLVAPAAAFLLLMTGVASGCSSGMQQGNELPPNNIMVLQQLADRMGRKIGATQGVRADSSVRVTVLPRETGYFLDDAVRTGVLASSGMSGNEKPVKVEVGLLEMKVTYQNLRSTGFWGPQSVDRNVLLSAQARVWTGADTALASILVNESWTDTVRVEDVAKLENSIIGPSRGTLPAEGMFGSVIEPLVLAGAIGVAVFLLFSVRS